MEGFGAMAGALLSVIGILILAYWSSRFLGKRWGGGTSGRYLKIIDRLQVGADCYILLVKLEDHTYLVGVSEKGIQLLTEPDGTFEEPVQEEKTMSFQELLKTYGAFRSEKRGEKHE